jgi:hypothetical protein
MVFSPDQRKSISPSHQQSFMKLLKRLCLMIEECVTVLNTIALHLESPKTHPHCDQVLQETSEQCSLLSARVRASGMNRRAHRDSQRQQFALLQAIASEIVDIESMFSDLATELRAWGPVSASTSLADLALLKVIVLIVHYSKLTLITPLNETKPGEQSPIAPFQMLKEQEIDPGTQLVDAASLQKLEVLRGLSIENLEKRFTVQRTNGFVTFYLKITRSKGTCPGWFTRWNFECTRRLARNVRKS